MIFKWYILKKICTSYKINRHIDAPLSLLTKIICLKLVEKSDSRWMTLIQMMNRKVIFPSWFYIFSFFRNVNRMKWRNGIWTCWRTGWRHLHLAQYNLYIFCLYRSFESETKIKRFSISNFTFSYSQISCILWCISIN